MESKGNIFSESELENVLKKHPDVPGASISIICNNFHEIINISAGYSRVKYHEKMNNEHYLQCASLSKTIATAFSIEFFKSKGISMKKSVNDLLKFIGSSWRLSKAKSIKQYGINPDKVTLSMLVNHTALGMHYVYGIPINKEFPSAVKLLDGSIEKEFGYSSLLVERLPGESFSYSGGGFVVLQYLIEEMEKDTIENITRPFLDLCGLENFTFKQFSDPIKNRYAYGHKTFKEEVDPPLAFPPFAAGGLCPPSSLACFLVHLAIAYSDKSGSGPISHETAILMLDDKHLIDKGAIDFMGAKMGLGVFVAKAGTNRIMLHQAANDGFRGVYMLCFAGPDKGKGFVILSNGDNPAVLLQCELARKLLSNSVLGFSGIQFDLYEKSDLSFDTSNVKQESIVNKGLKDLVLFAFKDFDKWPSTSFFSWPLFSRL